MDIKPKVVRNSINTGKSIPPDPTLEIISCYSFANWEATVLTPEGVEEGRGTVQDRLRCNDDDGDAHLILQKKPRSPQKK